MNQTAGASRSESEQRSAVFLFGAYYWLVSVAVGVFAPFIGVYFFELGYSATQIGILTSIGPFTAVITQPLWGVFADRARRRTTVLRIAILGALFASLCYLVHDGFVYVLIVTGVYTAFAHAFRPLHDSIILDYLHGTRFAFAPIRLAGTVGFAMIVIVSGSIIGVRVTRMFPLHAVLLALTSVVTIFFPRVANASGSRPTLKNSTVFRFGPVRFVYAYCLVLYVAFGFHASFLPVYMRNLGMSTADVGLANGIGTLSEIPVLLVIERVIFHLGAPKVLIGAGALTAVRMLVYSGRPVFPVIAAAQFLQGATLIAAYYCAVTILNDTVPRGRKSTAHALFAVTISGVSRIVGSMGGGALADTIGLGRTFQTAFWITLVATVLSTIFARSVLASPRLPDYSRLAASRGKLADDSPPLDAPRDP